MRNLRALLLLLPLVGGCYKANFVNLSDGSPGVTQTMWVNTLLWGLVSLNDVDVKTLCGDAGAFRVSSNQNVISFILSGITGGIYSPVIAHITCKAAR